MSFVATKHVRYQNHDVKSVPEKLPIWVISTPFVVGVTRKQEEERIK